MGAKGSATARVGLDVTAFERGAQAIFKSVNAINSSIKTIAAVTGGAFLFGKAIEGANAFKNSIVDGVTASLKLGEELANISRGAGAFAGSLYTLQFALEKGISNERTAKLFGREAKLLSENAGLFRDTSIKLSIIGERVKGFWLGVTEKAAPVLDRAFDKIIKFDFVGWGEKITEPFAKIGGIIFQAIVDGRVIESLKAIGSILAAAIMDAFDTAMAYAEKMFMTKYPRASGIIKAGETANKMGESFVNMIPSWIIAKKLWGLDVKPEDSAPKVDFTRTTKRTDEAMKIFDALLEKFNATSGANRSDPLENKKAYQNFGVDSLQAVGGGGGVGPVISLADTAMKQLNVQMKSLDKLTSMEKTLQEQQRKANGPSVVTDDAAMYSNFDDGGI